MSGFLSRVVAERRAETDALRVAADPGRLREAAARAPARDFAGALRGGHAVIAEFKRRSPSVDAFRHGGDPAALARIYAGAGAAALSVVACPRHFGSDLDDATAARRAAGLPLLVKDFVVDPLQVLAARAAGADAVLLIARVLSADELADLLGRVRELGAEALVECHDERDVAAARAAGATLVGVNSRDLETLAVDASAPRRLLPQAAAFALAVAESGIRTRTDVLDLAACGASAFLVGGALLQAEDPAAQLRRLTGEAP